MRNQRGITLIALIITIIVMLILVGVTVNVALNGGLFTTAKKAASETQIAAEQETLLSAVIATMTDGKVDFEKLDNNLPNGFTGSNGKYKSEKGNKYRVYKDGEVEYSREPDEPTPIYASLEDNNDGEGTKTLVFTVAENTKEGAINLGQVADRYLASNSDNLPMPEWYVNETYRNSITRAEIRDVIKPKEATAYWFYNLRNLVTIDKMENLYTSNITDCRSMFNECNKLKELDVSRFDTENVTDINGMFCGCSSLSELDVSRFDTSKVTNMNGMFSRCSNLTKIDVSGFNTSNVQRMGTVFSNCKKLTYIDVSGFDTSKVTYTNGMFEYCSSLKNIDVSKFNTSKINNIMSMFNNCSNLSATITIDPSSIKDQSNGSETIPGYDKFFYNAATEAGAKITVRCKAEHKEEVEKIVNTKSANSNVVLEVID